MAADHWGYGQIQAVCKRQVSQASRRRGHRNERVQESHCELCHRGAFQQDAEIKTQVDNAQQPLRGCAGQVGFGPK